MKSYRAAIIGLGRMASTIDDEVRDYPAITLPYSIAAACRAIPRLELVAGADPLPEKRVAFQERWGVSALYDDSHRMLRQEAPDLVAVCTRGELHAEHAIAVAEAGVPMLYLEKAMACSMAEADAVRAAVEKRGTSFNTGALRRFDPRYHRARQLIAAGEIGEPRVAVHFAATNLLHGHIHSVDTLLFLLGDPSAARVRGELSPRDLALASRRLDRDPNAIYQIEFQNGQEAFTIPAGTWDFEVIGSDGFVRGSGNGAHWALWQQTPLPDSRHRAMREGLFPPAEPRSATVACLEDLIDAHETGRPTLGNVAVTHHATEICFAVAESHARGGTWVDLPLPKRDLYIWHI